jgi:hypothetical protein
LQRETFCVLILLLPRRYSPRLLVFEKVERWSSPTTISTQILLLFPPSFSLKKALLKTTTTIHRDSFSSSKKTTTRAICIFSSQIWWV